MAEPVTDGNIDIRKKAFSRWLNHHFQQRPNLKIKIKEDDLTKSFSDGIYLANLLEIVSKRILFRWNSKPKNRSEKIKNLEQCLAMIACPPIVSAESVADGNETAVLSLVWNLIQTYHIKLPGEEFKMAKIRFRPKLQERGIEVTNFTSDFKNHPDRFAQLVNLVQPGIIPEKQLKTRKPKKIISLAMNIAYTRLGIPKLLDVSDIFSKHPDELANITYFGYFIESAEPKVAIFNVISPQRQLTRTGTTSRNTVDNSFENVAIPKNLVIPENVAIPENLKISSRNLPAAFLSPNRVVPVIPENITAELMKTFHKKNRSRTESDSDIPPVSQQSVPRAKSEGHTTLREKTSEKFRSEGSSSLLDSFH